MWKATFHPKVHQAKKNMSAGVKKSMAIENDRKRPALSVVDTCRYIMLQDIWYMPCGKVFISEQKLFSGDDMFNFVRQLKIVVRSILNAEFLVYYKKEHI